MNTSWSILYRGPLSSCNYECSYCPFAKTQSTRAELTADENCLTRFTGWVSARPEEIGVLFTPWGEALGHRYYQRALCQLSHMSNVRRVAIQTNLSARLDWVTEANSESLALWCTFHPTQTTVTHFHAQCRLLDAAHIRYSVGVVGLKEALPFLDPLRAGLRNHVYVWVNAFKREPDYYTQAEINALTAVDPLFPVNNQRHPSRGRPCRTGHSVFTVDGMGDMRRCHFVKQVIGNIYQPGFEASLQPRLCPAETCGCHIGYTHLEELRLSEVFGDGLLERIPQKHSRGLDATSAPARIRP